MDGKVFPMKMSLSKTLFGLCFVIQNSSHFRIPYTNVTCMLTIARIMLSSDPFSAEELFDSEMNNDVAGCPRLVG